MGFFKRRKKNTVDEDFELGKSSMEHGDYPSAIRHFSTSAENGNADAATVIGTMLYSGKDVEQDLARAEYWLLKAENTGNGNPVASYTLGKLYGFGPEEFRDVSKAEQYLLDAKEKGYIRAEDKLNELHESLREAERARRNAGIAPVSVQERGGTHTAAEISSPLFEGFSEFKFRDSEGNIFSSKDDVQWNLKDVISMRLYFNPDHPEQSFSGNDLLYFEIALQSNDFKNYRNYTVGDHKSYEFTLGEPLLFTRRVKGFRTAMTKVMEEYHYACYWDRQCLMFVTDDAAAAELFQNFYLHTELSVTEDGKGLVITCTKK